MSCIYKCPIVRPVFIAIQSEVYSSGSVFDSAGTCVPTMVSWR